MANLIERRSPATMACQPRHPYRPNAKRNPWHVNCFDAINEGTGYYHHWRPYPIWAAHRMYIARSPQHFERQRRRNYRIAPIWPRMRGPYKRAY